MNYSNFLLENESKNKNKSQELLAILEKKCEGLEHLLCKNVMKTISQKIDSIEKRFPIGPDKHLIDELQVNVRRKKSDEERKVNLLNENLNIIERSFNSDLISRDSQFSEIIREKIEENYKLLNELEKSNRPIFTKTTEINNTMFVEDKIKEMDNKLGILFKSENAKNYSARNIDIYTNKSELTRNTRRSYNSENTTDTVLEKTHEDTTNEKTNKEIEREIKKKELYDKLTSTERRIKEIAGSLLKNF